MSIDIDKLRIENDEFEQEENHQEVGRSSLFGSRVRWEEVETAVYPYDTEANDVISYIEGLRDDGVEVKVLYSLVSLIGQAKGVAIVSAKTSPVGACEHLYILASFFVGSSLYNLKLDAIKLIMVMLLPPVGSGDEDDSVVESMFDYVLGHDFGWNEPVHSQLVLFQRIRQACFIIQEKQKEMERIMKRAVAHVVHGGDAAARMICNTALALETGLSWSVPVLTGGIDCAGKLLKQVITPGQRQKTPTGVVASAYTDAAKRATDQVRVGTKTAAHGLRDVSTTGLTTLARKFEEERLGEVLLRNKHQRDVVMAAGKVGMASVGAMAIVSEAVVNTTAEVLKQTATTTTDVVRYKYGDSAAQIVQDTSHATGNVMRTVSHVAMLEGKILSRAVAKNTSKVLVKQTASPDQCIRHPR